MTALYGIMPKFPAGVHRVRRGTMAGTLPSAEHRRGWWHEYSGDGAHTKVRAECSNAKCSYTGTFHADRLAIELAVDALAGHTEYRLTT